MFTEIVSVLTKSKRRAFAVLATLAALNVFLFAALGATARGADGITVSFLDVGQGDATLIDFGDGVQVLIDGGPPNGRLVAELGELLPPTDRTIELVILTHPELDHYGGLIELLKRYEVGAFLDNGVAKNVDAYRTLAATLAEKKIRGTVLRVGDRIRYGGNLFTVLSPDEAQARARETNDTSVVLEFESGDPDTEVGASARFLFTGDIGAEVERAVAEDVETPFDVLKVAHHGSKFSSDVSFLASVRPALAAIGVGKNSYGHPTREALARLEATGARIYRTDRDGTVTMQVENGELYVLSKK